MAVYMVNAILGVILNYKNHCVFPHRTLAHRFDQLSKSFIVVGNMRCRRWGSGFRTAGMVLRKIDRHQVWNLLLGHKLGIRLFEHTNTKQVRDIHIPARERPYAMLTNTLDAD